MFESSGVVGCLVSAAPPRGLGSEPGTVIASLADAPGSSGAVALLAAIDPAHLSCAERVDLIRAWERQAVLGCLRAAVRGGRPGGPGADEYPDPRPEPICVPDWCREEISAALHVTGAAAQTRLDLARDLRSRLPRTAAALQAGR